MPNQNDPTHFLEGNFKYKVFSLTKYSISVRGSKTWNEPLLTYNDNMAEGLE